MNTKEVEYGKALKKGDLILLEMGLITIGIMTDKGYIGFGRYSKIPHYQKRRPQKRQHGHWTSVPEVHRKTELDLK